jgi:hypothetical protein
MKRIAFLVVGLAIVGVVAACATSKPLRPMSPEAKEQYWRWEECEELLRRDFCDGRPAEKCPAIMGRLKTKYHYSRTPFLTLFRMGCNTGAPSRGPQERPACDPYPDPCQGMNGGEVDDGCGRTIHCPEHKELPLPQD